MDRFFIFFFMLDVEDNIEENIDENCGIENEFLKFKLFLYDVSCFELKFGYVYFREEDLLSFLFLLFLLIEDESN